MDTRRDTGSCREYGEIICAYLDDELSALELVDLAAHLKQCPACNREMDGLMSAKNALHQAEPFWSKSVPGEGFLPALLARVREEAGEPAQQRAARRLPAAFLPPPRFASWAAAAALAVLLVLGAASLFFRPQPSLVASGSGTPPPASFLMARSDTQDGTEEYLREHALESSRNLLLEDEYDLELVDHARP